MENSDQKIIHLLSKKDSAGLRIMFDRYYVPLCLYALKYLDSYDQSEDLVQDIFITFWEKNMIAKLKGNLKAYLFTAVRNNALAYLRKQNRYFMVELDDSLEMFLEDIPNQEELEKKKEHVYREINKLSPQAKLIFESIIFDNKKYKEVALEMNISINTVKTQFSRALKKMRNSLSYISYILLV